MKKISDIVLNVFSILYAICMILGFLGFLLFSLSVIIGIISLIYGGFEYILNGESDVLPMSLDAFSLKELAYKWYIVTSALLYIFYFIYKKFEYKLKNWYNNLFITNEDINSDDEKDNNILPNKMQKIKTSNNTDVLDIKRTVSSNNQVSKNVKIQTYTMQDLIQMNEENRKTLINIFGENIVNSFVPQPSTDDVNSIKDKNSQSISKNTTYHPVDYTRPIGDIYEEYIGHLLENDGYSLEYNGIEKRRKDEGIDLIATKDNITLLIQCKCWKKTTVISKSSINSIKGKSKYNCIARLYIQAKLYALRHNIKQYTAVLYYTCQVSDNAKSEAKKYNIVLKRELLPSWKKD